MTLPTKIILISVGIIVGILLSFGSSDLEILIKDKTQAQKDLFNYIARGASVVSVTIFVLTILKKIKMRPKWSYFVMGIASTYSVINILVLTIFPKLFSQNN